MAGREGIGRTRRDLLFEGGDRREFCGKKGCPESILGADGGLSAAKSLEWPGDVEGGVVPGDGAFSGWVVEIGGLIEDLSCIRENKEAVGEAFGNP